MKTRNPAVPARFAANMKIRRHEIGVSQDELAKWTGLHRTEISLLERGQREPRVGTLVKLATALDISTDALLDGIGWRLAGGGRRAIVVTSDETS